VRSGRDVSFDAEPFVRENVTEVFRPTALALKIEERNRIQVTPKASCQRTISFREYKNFGFGEGAAGSPTSSGAANAVAVMGASNAFTGFAAGRKNTLLPVREWSGVTLAAELAVRSDATLALLLFGGRGLLRLRNTHASKHQQRRRKNPHDVAPLRGLAPRLGIATLLR